MILDKGEVSLQKTSRRLCRADFHGFIIIRGIEDGITINRVIFEKMLNEHGGMSEVLHHKKTGLKVPRGWGLVRVDSIHVEGPLQLQ